MPAGNLGLRIGDKLVAINDINVDGYDEQTVEEIWMDESEKGPNLELYFE